MTYYTYTTADGRYVTMNGYTPTLCQSRGLARMHQTLAEAERELPMLEKALGVSLKIVVDTLEHTH